MKYSAEEMALKILQLNAVRGNPVQCAITTFAGQIVLITDFPGELAVPEDSDEQWYFAQGRFTNKHNTKTGVYATLPVYSFEDAGFTGWFAS
jgi:hypothetical protein